MGGNIKVWIVVATWFWWNAVVGPAWACPVEQHTLSWSGTFMVAEPHTLNYQTVTFTTKNATKTSYTQFIEALRAQLESGEKRHGIPVMRERSTVPDSQRFVLVELSNWESDSPVTLAVDVTNAYVVAYRNGSRSFFFKEKKPDPAIAKLFPNTTRNILSFSGSYTDLERVAGKRETIELGMGPLDGNITALRISNMEQQRPIARSLIVVIQMVAEAARFTYIEYHVRKRIPKVEETFLPPPTMLSYENDWDRLSTAVQQSNQGGVFLTPVKFTEIYNNYLEVDNTNHPTIKGLAIMLFSCKSKSDGAATTNHQHFIDHDMLMIRPVVVDADVATNVDKEVDEDDDDDDTFPYKEPTVRISGRNGLCVDASDGQYNNGNPIRLWPCQKQLDIVNQLWTLRKDGTIRSNSMCLTTNGSSPGSHVMIYDCAAAEKAATLWQLWENGTIKNPKSGLVLSAESGDSDTTLTVETNIYASRQGWFASNNIEPFVTFIIGFNDLCMQANGSDVWVVECADQKWALYPDGSIRPHQDPDGPDRCLTCSDNHSQGSTIIISKSCSDGSGGERWVFRNDGAILNLASGMVMEVKGSDPSLLQIILSGFTGNPNQKWLPLFSLLQF